MSRELSPRAKAILSAVVAQHLATAGPVGSRTISKQGMVEGSAATIRNIMSDLEEMGYLSQPHVSAGRVPTILGLRFYVDSLLEVKDLEPRIKRQIHTMLRDEQDAELSDVLKLTSRVLSAISRNVAVVSTPNPEREFFRHLEFIQLKPGLVLVVLVSAAGKVQNRVIETEEDLGQEDLEKFARLLNERLSDLSLSEMRRTLGRELAQEKAQFDQVLSRALELGRQALSTEVRKDIFIDGQANLFNVPEFHDVSRLKQIFQALEEKTHLLRLVEKSSMARGVQIFIGAESEMAGMEELSVVTSSYGDRNTPLGALGVIGPTRMDYSIVIPVVDYTARLVTRILEERGCA